MKIETTDEMFKFLPEGTIVFGGAIRDQIRGRQVNDIDLLFKSETELNEFVEDLKIRVNNNLRIKIEGSNKYDGEKGFKHYKLFSDYYNSNFAKEAIAFDCIIPENKDQAFLSDFDVNSLYGVISKEGDKTVINAVGNVFGDFNKIIENIKSGIATSCFKLGTKQYKKDWRTEKLASKCWFINHKPEAFQEAFESSDDIFEKCSLFIGNVLNNQVKVSTSEKTGETKMTNNSKKSFTERNVENIREGAYQGLATKVVDGVAEGVILALKKSGMDEVSVAMIESVINTPIGKSLIAMGIGSGAQFLPGEYGQNEHVQHIADKCVQNAGAAGITELINLATAFLLPAFQNAIAGNKQLEMLDKLSGNTSKFRVTDMPKDQDDVSEDELAEFRAFKQQKLKAGLNNK